MATGVDLSGEVVKEKVDAGCPVSNAMACCNCERVMSIAVFWASAVSSCVSACATASSEAMPVSKSTFSKRRDSR